MAFLKLRKDQRDPRAILTIEGDCARPRAFTHHQLAHVHRDYQVDDLSTVDERLAGKGVRLRALVDEVGPGFHARYLTVEAEDGDFSACLPLDDIARTAVIVYERDGQPLSRDQGGPVRFIVPYYPDKCANVKAATRIVISEEPRKDTRPSNATEHAAIHAKD